MLRKISRIIRAKAFIWSKNMLKYLSLDIIRSPKLTDFLKVLESCSLLRTDVTRQISEHTFTPNGGYCLYISHLLRDSQPTNKWPLTDNYMDWLSTNTKTATHDKRDPGILQISKAGTLIHVLTSCSLNHAVHFFPLFTFCASSSLLFHLRKCLRHFQCK